METSMRKLLVLSILLVGCSRQVHYTDPRDIHGIDPAFTAIVAEFESYLGRSIGDIPIGFGPGGGDVVGRCSVWNSEWREIKIDPEYWNYMGQWGHIPDEDARTALLFHELGHCVLNRGHLNTMWNNNGWSVYTSFMNFAVFFSSQYSAFESKAYYVNELFHPAPGAPMMSDSASEEDDDFVHINTGNI
jgi:hypothetical protein